MTNVGFEPPRVADVLRAHFLQLEDLTQDKLATALGVSRHSVNELMNHRRSITAPMALRLARVLGTDPHFWINIQVERDLFEARRQHAAEIDALEPLLEQQSEEEVIQPFETLFRSETRERKAS
jgi:addiction module HigA family antidote